MGTTSRLNRAPNRQRQLDLLTHPDHMWRRLFVRGKNDELERLQGFRPGGYFPLHLHDELHNGRYRIIHKLGHGGLATVWLCRDENADTPTYVAIKILVASEVEHENAEIKLAAALKKKGLDKIAAGQHLCLPQEHFISQSPNGQHICLVFPVLGPTVHDVTELFGPGESLPRTVQEISRHVVEALGVLHENGVCHGDLRPSNILLGLQSLDGLRVDQVFARLEVPETTDIIIRKDAHLTSNIPHAPKYLVYPVDFGSIDAEFVLPRANIIDFGQSFNLSHPPASYGIPTNYSAPEVVLDHRGTAAMDMWSLGCTLYEIRLGQRLFDVFQLIDTRKEDYVNEVASLLGKPPGRWAEFFEQDDEAELDVSPDHPYLQEERVYSIYEKLASRHDCRGQDCDHPRFQVISETEAADLADLLEKLLKYQAEERLSVREVLKHSWFNTDY
ncbi:serine/threonine-protein kinase SRPK3 [Colletotrichum truncatum]|uniref:Serine/threonine-protein kinase SRPK3 n=1 Tax=Colletotrichum truncatum TaxID=5467 RepID=A0ACC3YCL2_COLTU|nr:serine/threonine-protein kinase SRPK3 [Colletotrichum truncatum]KAF6794052.1 serine/threonine-protein kinase SRPK3 [Colletotrichum truncatum]